MIKPKPKGLGFFFYNNGMPTFNDFKLLYAETMHYCQMLEWNMKSLYIIHYKNEGSKDDWNAICFESGKIKFGEAYNNIKQKDKECKILSKEFRLKMDNFIGGRHFLAHDIFNKIVFGNEKFEQLDEFKRFYKALLIFRDNFKDLAFTTTKEINEHLNRHPELISFPLPWYIRNEKKS